MRQRHMLPVSIENIATMSDNDGGRFLSLSEIQLRESTVSTLNIQAGIFKQCGP